MGWSESYYRDYLAQARKDWRERADAFLREAEGFFSEMTAGEPPLEMPDHQVRMILSLWEEMRTILLNHLPPEDA